MTIFFSQLFYSHYPFIFFPWPYWAVKRKLRHANIDRNHMEAIFTSKLHDEPFYKPFSHLRECTFRKHNCKIHSSPAVSSSMNRATTATATIAARSVRSPPAPLPRQPAGRPCLPCRLFKGRARARYHPRLRASWIRLIQPVAFIARPLRALGIIVPVECGRFFSSIIQGRRESWRWFAKGWGDSLCRITGGTTRSGLGVINQC